MKLAIVILNWNGAKMLSQFLPSVIANSRDAEIIVADNASTDDSLELLASSFPQIRTIILDKNYGFAEGYNQALRQVEAEYYLLLNSDVEVTEGWLTPMIAYFDSHPMVAACQPKIRCQWAPEMLEYAGACGGFIDKLGYPYCRGRVFGTLERDNAQYDDVCQIAWATGAAMMVRSKVYWEVGGLDGRFFAHQEEIDLCWRMRSRGYGIVCVPQSVVFHVGGGTLPKESPRKTFLNFRNNMLLLYKNLSDDNLNQVMRWRFWLDALASVQFLLKGERGSFCAVWQARREFNAIKHDFQADRERNLSLRKETDEQILSPICLLWQYYVCGRKTYSQLGS